MKKNKNLYFIYNIKILKNKKVMIWKTKITQMAEIRYPIIMGAFAAIGCAEFAAAFSNAGGLGIITAINYPTIEDFQKELEKMSKLTKKPFGVNFTITPPYLAKKGRGTTEVRDFALPEGAVVLDPKTTALLHLWWVL